MIDLRSDTVTKPTLPMLEAMVKAEVGDDVFGDDPTVNALQERLAKMFGMEAGQYCPSGTMTNQIAIRVHTQPQDEVICHKYSHVYLYEGGGMMYNSMVSACLLDGERGMIRADQVKEAINPDDIHRPVSRLVVLENTMNKGGGAIYSLEEIRKISKLCQENELRLHLDGARLFNALVETGEDPKTFGKMFDSISICFSKGLGAPVGSVLLGSKEDIRKARRIRKVLGGGMRQAGFIAAGCLYALDHHVDRLKEDHERAKKIGKALEAQTWVKEVYPVETNIVIAQIEGISVYDLLQKLADKKVYPVKFGKDLIRFVTHLNFADDHLDQFEKVLKEIG